MGRKWLAGSNQKLAPFIRLAPSTGCTV